MSVFIDSNIPMYLVGSDHPNKTRAARALSELITHGRFRPSCRTGRAAVTLESARTDRSSKSSARMRARALLALFVAGAAALASAPESEPAYEVFNSMPGPFFLLADNRPIVDWLVTITASPEAFPPRGGWSELVEVELDMFEEGLDLDQRLVFGRLGRVAPDGLTVPTSTVVRIDVPDQGTLILTDQIGVTPCQDGVCRKQYLVRFVLSGLGGLRTQWFLRAGIDWDIDGQPVPEAAVVTLEIQPL